MKRYNAVFLIFTLLKNNVKSFSSRKSFIIRENTEWELILLLNQRILEWNTGFTVGITEYSLLE